MTARRRSRRSKTPRLTAKNADKHVLYQMAVQDPEAEISFIDDVFRRHRRRKALSLREDFCGSALLCSRWVESSPKRTATGVDLDPEVLAWGKRNNLSHLHEAGDRVRLLKQNVLDGTREKFDVVNALNFSYWVFRTRQEMRNYFSVAWRGLKRDGVFICDAYGGWESQEPMEEARSIKGRFTYVWDQYSFNPIDHGIRNYIHFRFKDGSKIERAFRYDWRYWTLPELRELMSEAGFSEVLVYWDRSDNDRYEDYRPTLRGDNHPGWLAYVVGLR